MMILEEPDKGFAWIVAISAFFISLILSGISRVVGILYLHIIKFYSISRRQATVPFTVRNSVRCLAGPFVGVFGQRYGVRKLTFFGGLVTGSGAALSSIAPDILCLTIFWGGIHGLGFAFAYTLFRVTINQYFKKYRSTALGIALSGSCVGSLIFPFLVEILLSYYDLNGTFLIIGGIIFHVVPCSLFLRTPPWVKNPEKYKKLVAETEPRKSLQAENMPVEIQANVAVDKVEIDSLSDNPVEELKLMPFTDSNLPPLVLTRNVKNKINSHVNENLKEEKPEEKKLENLCERSPCNLNIPAVSKVGSENSSTESVFMPQAYNGKNTSTMDNNLCSANVTKNVWSLKDGFITMFMLYKNPMFVVICVSTTTYQMVLTIVFSILVDYGVDKGISPSDGKYLINSMAIGDLLGRIGFGWVTDKGYLSAQSFMMLLNTFQGSLLALFPTTNSFSSYTVILFMFGMVLGCSMVLFPVLIYKYVPHDIQTLAIGGAGLMSGIVSFSVPAMIGHFRDNLGSYDKIFYLLGFLTILTGWLYAIVPVSMKFFYNERTLDDLFGKPSP